MTAEEKYGIDSDRNAAFNRRGNNRVISCKDDNSEEEKGIEENRRSSGDDARKLVFKGHANIGGIGKMSEYAQTGIYIDPH